MKKQQDLVKKWYESKTMLTAAVQLGLAIVVYFATEYPEASGFLAAKSALDVLLRLLTDKGVEA